MTRVDLLPEDGAVSEMWEIKYRGAEVSKFFDWYSWEQAQKFVNEVDVISIVFYASGLTGKVNGRAHETGRLYEEPLTKGDLAEVSMELIEERRKRLREKYASQS